MTGLRAYAEGATLPRPPLLHLGRTGLLVSALGLGLAGLGRPAYMTLGRDEDLGQDRSVAAMRRRCQALLDMAYAAGVRYVDAARSYGLAEHFLRAWCDERRIPDGALTIGSKWGYTYTGAWRLHPPAHEVKRLAVDTLQWQSAESRAVLGRRLSLYQAHSVTLESGILDDRAIVAELTRLRSQGLHIGLTVTGPRQADTVRRALDIVVDGVPLFESVQATWNLLEPSAGPALEEACDAGLGVIVKEALANGRLTNRHAGPSLRPLRDHADAAATTLDTLAMAAALTQPWASIVLSGAVTCAQLEGHLAALDIAEDVIPPPLPEPPEAYWRTRSAIGWN
jgi:aryl-alcohol dehydrogenase-like predicted oxidoreductase